MNEKITKHIAAVYEEEVAVFTITSFQDVEPLSAIRDAAYDFLNTEAGQYYLEDICFDDFNWGDSLNIPQEILEKHGVLHYEMMDEVYFVNFDEVLVPEQRRN